MSAACAVADCERTDRITSGWCWPHYTRWLQKGDVQAHIPVVRRVTGGPEAQFLAYSDRNGPVPSNRPDLGPCWARTGRKSRAGYGYLTVNGCEVPAHRWAYGHYVAALPAGIEPDHLCRNSSCVNYERHLEAVTHRENTLRGESPPARFARRTACNNGHEYTPANTTIRRDGSRQCRTCNRARCRSRYHARRRVEVEAQAR